MFEGRNDLVLNTATVILALQEYFDKRLSSEAQPCKITGFEPVDFALWNSPSLKTFRVTIEKPENVIVVPANF